MQLREQVKLHEYGHPKFPNHQHYYINIFYNCYRTGGSAFLWSDLLQQYADPILIPWMRDA
jgi:hypothetical protein